MDIRSDKLHVVIDNLSVNLAFVVFFRKLTSESNQETPVGLEWLFCLGGNGQLSPSRHHPGFSPELFPW